MGILFLLVGITAIVESALGIVWAPFHFRIGIPIYSRSFRARYPVKIAPADLQQEFRGPPRMLFRQLSDNELAFREGLFSIGFRYTLIMRGHLVLARDSIRVIGRLNWSVLAFAISICCFSLISLSTKPFASDMSDTAKALVPAMGIVPFLLIGGAIYAMQANTYGQIGRYLTTAKRPKRPDWRTTQRAAK